MHGSETIVVDLLCPNFYQAETEELKKQIEELSSRLSSLTAERNNLQNRNSLLEKVVQVRGGDSTSAAAQV